MSGKLVRKFRWFWDDADHAIEQWLQEMARQGLHLQRVSCLRMMFVFKRGEPADVTYRIDFQLTRKDPSYVQLFTDAGWEHVDELLGWQYWRAPTRPGRATEIFTDVESAIVKYKRMLLLFGICAVSSMLTLVPRQDKSFFNDPLELGLMLASIGLLFYAVIRLVLRIRRLRRQGQ
jgi:hypothetical protein